MATQILLSTSSNTASDWLRISGQLSEYEDRVIYQLGQHVFAAMRGTSIPPGANKLHVKDIKILSRAEGSTIRTSQGDLRCLIGIKIGDSDEELAMSRSFVEEAKQHFSRDIEELSERFGVSQVEVVYIQAAGNETHYVGKVPLFLTFITSNKIVKLVYKPRSISPEIILEDARCQLSGGRPRAMLDCRDHGYDMFIDGDPIPGEDSPFELRKSLIELSDKSRHNKALIYAISKLGIEDVHAHNFIVDGQQCLHFIDAEVYLTGVSTKIDGVFVLEKADSSDEDSSPLSSPVNWTRDIEMESRLTASFVDRFQSQLRMNPTRLVIGSTKFYTILHISGFPKKVKIGEFDIDGIQTATDYHLINIARFLESQNIVIFNNQEKHSMPGLKAQVLSVIKESGAQAIEREVDKCREVAKREKCFELPAFKYNYRELYIECPLTREKIYLSETKK